MVGARVATSRSASASGSTPNMVRKRPSVNTPRKSARYPCGTRPRQGGIASSASANCSSRFMPAVSGLLRAVRPRTRRRASAVAGEADEAGRPQAQPQPGERRKARGTAPRDAPDTADDRRGRAFDGAPITPRSSWSTGCSSASRAAAKRQRRAKAAAYQAGKAGSAAIRRGRSVEHLARLRDLQGGLARHAVVIDAPGRDHLRRKAEPVGQRDLAGEIAVGERAEPRVEAAERDDRVAPEYRAAGQDPVVDAREQRTRARGVDEAGAAQRPDRRAHADRAAGEAVDQQGLAAEQAGVRDDARADRARGGKKPGIT